MKTTLVEEYREVAVRIDDTLGVMSCSKAQVFISGTGATKHEAVKNALAAVKLLQGQITEYFAKLDGL
jgi:hypothetical protein